jgi:tripartite-type tricarboxylate transporter receptor subunit TctC
MRGWRLAAGATLLLVALGAQAQGGYPDRTLRIVVPFSAGGGTDVQARVAAARRVGAGGNIGTAAVAQSAQFLDQESARWAKVLGEAKIRID